MIHNKSQQLSLVISVKSGGYRMDDPLNDIATNDYAKIRLRVIVRDKYKCQFCAFKSIPDRKAATGSLLASGYLEVHHLDDNHHNNQLSNLITICPFCHAIFHLGFSAHKDKVALIYFPWLRQSNINLLTLCLGVAISRKGKYSEDAIVLLKWLESHDKALKLNYGEALSDPVKLSTSLRTLAHREPLLYKKRSKALADFRVVPKINKYKTQIQYWSKTCVLENTWQRIYTQWQKDMMKM